MSNFNIYLGLGACFLPLLICFFLIWKICKTKISHQLLACLLGLLAVLPTSFLLFWIEAIFNSKVIYLTRGIGGLFLKTLLLNGIIEELFKMVFTLFIPAKKNNLKAFFGLSLLLGLSLGCFESMVYLLQNIQRNSVSGGEFLWKAILLRIFSADLIHTFCTGLCGLFIWSCKTKKINFAPLIVAILCHGLFDFFVSFQSGIQWFSVAVIFMTLLESRIRYMKLDPVLSDQQTNQKEDIAETVVEQTLDGVRLEGNELVKDEE